MKRLLTILLALLLAVNTLSLAPVKVYADGEEVVEQEQQEPQEEIKEEEQQPEEELPEVIEEEEPQEKLEQAPLQLNEPSPTEYVTEDYFEVIDGTITLGDNVYSATAPTSHYEKRETFVGPISGKFVVAEGIYEGKFHNSEYNDGHYYVQCDGILEKGIYQVPYIESHGSEFIDTLVKPDNDYTHKTLIKAQATRLLTFDAEFQLMDKTGGQVLFGASDDTDFDGLYDGYWFETVKNNSSVDFSFGAGANNPVSQFKRKVDSNKHRITIGPSGEDTFTLMYDPISAKSFKVLLGNAEVKTKLGGYESWGAGLYHDIDKNVLLFADDKNGQLNFGSYRIYRFTIKNTKGETVRDFVPAFTLDVIPAEKSSTDTVINPGTYGLYDAANGIFFPNVGDGAFTCDDSPVAPVDAESDTTIVVKRYYDLKEYNLKFVDKFSQIYEMALPNTQKIELGDYEYYSDNNLVGYDFIGWNYKKADSFTEQTTKVEYQEGDIFEMPSEDGELEAVLKPHTYGIRINLNGGHFDGYEIYQAEEYDGNDGNNIEVPIPAKDNYQFVGFEVTGMDNTNHFVEGYGYTTSTNCENAYDNDGNKYVEFYNLTSEDGAFITLTAKWQIDDQSELVKKTDFVGRFFMESPEGMADTYDKIILLDECDELIKVLEKQIAEAKDKGDAVEQVRLEQQKEELEKEIKEAKMQLIEPLPNELKEPMKGSVNLKDHQPVVEVMNRYPNSEVREKFNLDVNNEKTIVLEKEEGPEYVDAYVLDYIQTHFDSESFANALSREAELEQIFGITGAYSKDLFDVQYIDTGLYSQDVYKVDMNVAIVDTKNTGEEEKKNGKNSSIPNSLFSAVEGCKFGEIKDVLKSGKSIRSYDLKSLSKAGLTLATIRESELLSLGGNNQSELFIPNEVLEGYEFPLVYSSSNQYLHVVNERDSRNKTVNLGAGLDSKTVSIPSTSATGIGSNIPFILFACNFDDYLIGSNFNIAGTKIYGKDGELLRDFVPVFVNKNGIEAEYSSTGEKIEGFTVCMYDKVEGLFYPNAGTGEFTYEDNIIPGVAGYANVGSNQFNVVFPREDHTVHYIDPASDQIMDLYLNGEEYEGVDYDSIESLFEGEELINFNDGLYKVLGEVDYRFEEVIDIPEVSTDKSGYEFIGWAAYDEDGNQLPYTSMITSHQGFFDPKYYDEKPFTMIEKDIYFVAQYMSFDQLPSPKLVIEPSYVEEGEPIYEANLFQKIALTCDDPNVDIYYSSSGKMPTKYDDFLKYEEPILVSLGNSSPKNPMIALNKDGYGKLYAFAVPKGFDFETKDDLTAFKSLTFSPIAAFTFYVNYLGDLKDLEEEEFIKLFGNVSAKELAMSFPRIMWMAYEKYDIEGKPVPAAVYDPATKEYKLSGDVYYYNQLLTEGKDYKLSYSNNKKAGTATLKITGKGSYTGTYTEEFEIVPLAVDQSCIEIELDRNTFVYNAREIQTPKVKAVYYIDPETQVRYKLKEKTDYTVVFEALRKLDYSEGIKTIDLIFQGNYQGIAHFEGYSKDGKHDGYVICEALDKPISDLKITGVKDVEYTGYPNYMETLVVKNGDYTLVRGKNDSEGDYWVEFADNISAGTTTLTIHGNDKEFMHPGYAGSVTLTYKIKGTEMSKLKFNKLPSYPYDHGKEVTVNTDDLYIIDSKHDNYRLQYGIDYTVEYKNNTKPGKATIIFTGIPHSGYTGSKSVTFTIEGTALSKFNQANLEKEITYVGAPIVQSVMNQTLYRVEKVNGYQEAQALSQYDADGYKNYDVKYSNNTNVGTATITYTGEGAYTGTVKKTFKIVPLDVTEFFEIETEKEKEKGKEPAILQPKLVYSDDIDEDGYLAEVQTYKKGGATAELEFNHIIAQLIKPKDHGDLPFTPAIIIPDVPVGPVFPLDGDYDEETLVLNKDYTISYKNNTKVTTDPEKPAYAVVKFKGNYKGTVTIPFFVRAQALADTTLSAADVKYTGKAGNTKSTVSVVDVNGKKLAAGTDYSKDVQYTYTYDSIVVDSKTKKAIIRKGGELVNANDIVYPGTEITITVDGINNYEGTATTTYEVCLNDINKVKASIRQQYYTGNGKPVTITKNDISLTLNGKRVENDCYEIISYENNTKAGTAKVTIIGTGSFGGTKTISFKIVNKPINTVVVRFFNAVGEFDEDKGEALDNPPYNTTGSMADFKISMSELAKNEYITIPTNKLKSVTKDFKYFKGWILLNAGGMNMSLEDMVIPADEDGVVKVPSDFIFEGLIAFDGVVDVTPLYWYEDVDLEDIFK